MSTFVAVPPRRTVPPFRGAVVTVVAAVRLPPGVVPVVGVLLPASFPQPTTAAVKQPVALTGVERLLLQTQGK